uniref:Early transcription factor large subunit-like protein n=1 Tax=Pithovirus LCPAC103 TaxID=2506588 RepID=A0A481Z5Q9_9VIRU|nr:MAG: early transcription factor large subunit-like protein [Pithovirus LCPAC103]
MATPKSCSGQRLDNIYTCVYKIALDKLVPSRQVRIISKRKLAGDGVSQQPITGLNDFLARFEVLTPMDIVKIHASSTPLEIKEMFQEFNLEDLTFAYYEKLRETIGENQGVLRPDGTSDLDFFSREYFEAIENYLPADTKDIINDALMKYGSAVPEELSSIESAYETWVVQGQEETGRDTDIVTQINRIQTTLLSSDVSQYLVSSINATKYTYAFDVNILPAELEKAGITETNGVGKEEFGITIFNKSITSSDVPLIQYNDVKGFNIENQLYRLYRGQVTGTIDYSKLISGSTQRLRSLYYRIFTGSGRRARSAGSYETIEYRVPEGKLLLTETMADAGRPGSKEHLIDKFTESNGVRVFVDPSRGIIDSIRGWFNIYHAKIVDVFFLDMVTTLSEFFNFVYMDESLVIYPNKNNLTLRTTQVSEVLKSGGLQEVLDNFEGEIAPPVRVTIKLENIETGLSYPVLVATTDTIRPIDITDKVPYYLKVSFTKVSSDQMVLDLRYLLLRLIAFYETQEPRVKQEYSQYFGNLELRGIDKPIKARGKPKPLTLLKDYDRRISRERGVPILIVKMYARSCEDKKKPTAIDKQDIIKELTADGQTIYRWTKNPTLQVLPFPNLIDPYWFFVCEHIDDPHPGVKISELPNKKAYPFSPCCYTKNVMTLENSNWANYVRGRRSIIKYPQNVETKILTRADIKPGRFSVIDDDLRSVLRQIVDDGYYRYGSPIGPNSLLHAVLAAVDERYRAIETLDNLESYTAGIRFAIASSIDPMIMAQETFDMADSSRYQNLADPETYLDPDLYYRALEEYFDVNIYVFTPEKIAVPRYRLFQVRYYRPTRPTILIYKHLGTNPSMLNFPQSELIVASPEKRDKISIFSVTRMFTEEMTKGIHLMYVNVLRNISWDVETPVKVLQPRQNLYNQIDYQQLIADIGGQIQAQVIDDLGKTRIVQFVITKATDTVSMIMYIVPGQPANVGNIQTEDLFEGLPSVQQVTSLLKPPNSIAVNDGQIVGFWYHILDVNNALFLPVKPIAITSGILAETPEGPPSLVQPLINSRYLRLQKLKRTVHIYLQLLLLAFSKYTSGGLEAFIDEYLVLEPVASELDSAAIYDFSSLIAAGIRWLPEFTDFGDAMLYIANKAPTVLTADGKFRAYSQKFLAGLEYFLKDYIKTMPDDQKGQPRLLRGVLTQESDFSRRADEIIFMGRETIDSWIELVTSADYEHIQIHKQVIIGETDVKRTPQLYGSPDGKIYLLQTTYLGTLRAAIQIGYSWQINKINIGYKAKEYQETSFPAYKIYFVGTDGLLRVQKDESRGETEYLRVVNYKGLSKPEEERVYAAMLNLL